MPTSIEMRLKATWTVRPDTRHLHGLACALFEGESADHLGQEKPFTIWPLSPAPGGAPQEWTWRTAWLPDALPPASALAADQLRVGHVACAVTKTTQRRVTRAQLAAGPPLDSVTVTFGSPTYFSQNGTDVLLPDPRLIVGSWRRRWNASLPDQDPLSIDDGTWLLSAAVGLLGLAVVPPDWWHDDGYTLHVAVWAAVLLSVAGLGYLYLEASSHDVRGWRRAWRPAAVAASGYLHAAMVSVIGLRFLLPEFSPRPASPPYLSCWWHAAGCGPDALPAWLLVFLAASWAFAAGVFLQIIWDDQPVTAPLAHVSWRRES